VRWIRKIWVFNRTIAYRDKRKLSVSLAFLLCRFHHRRHAAGTLLVQRLTELLWAHWL
jgi:hypothetical protein